MIPGFEWNQRKAKANLKKHGVSFEEAASVFWDTASFTIDDARYSEEEQRFFTIGMSSQNRIVVIAHTDRGENVRIISARLATPSERKGYEEGYI